jgi:acyl carrier protein
VDLGHIRGSDDFEVDLGAHPNDICFWMRDLEQEYDITIPVTDSKNRHAVGQAISYVERMEGK